MQIHESASATSAPGAMRADLLSPKFRSDFPVRIETRGGMGESGIERAEVLVMIDAFTSVGAISFDLTWTNAAGEEQAFRRNCPAPYLYRTLSSLLQDAERHRNNVIMRPRAEVAVTLVQLDDLNAGKLASVAAAAFLTLETSPGNYQAWAAMQSSEDKDFVRRFKKGVGADATHALTDIESGEV
jgi:hypothetical protein